MCNQQSLRSTCAYAQSDQSLCKSLEYSTSVKQLTEHHFEFLSLKGGCTGSSESTRQNTILLEITCCGSFFPSKRHWKCNMLCLQPAILDLSVVFHHFHHQRVFFPYFSKPKSGFHQVFKALEWFTSSFLCIRVNSSTILSSPSGFLALFMVIYRFSNNFQCLSMVFLYF